MTPVDEAFWKIHYFNEEIIQISEEMIPLQEEVNELESVLRLKATRLEFLQHHLKTLQDERTRLEYGRDQSINQ